MEQLNGVSKLTYQDNGNFSDYVNNWSEQFRIRMIQLEQLTYENKIIKAQQQLRFRLDLGVKAQ